MEEGIFVYVCASPILSPLRVITCNPQNEPILGILSRSLRKRVYQLKASSE